MSEKDIKNKDSETKKNRVVVFFDKKGKAFISITLFLIVSSLFAWFYNAYLYEKILSINKWWIKIFYLKLFTFSDNYSLIFNSLFLIGIAIFLFIKRCSLLDYSKKLLKSIRYFGALLQHYTISFLFILIITPIISFPFYQEAFCCKGDFVSLVIMFYFGIQVFGCIKGYKCKKNKGKPERADFQPINTRGKDHLGLDSTLDNLKKEILNTPKSSVFTIGLSGSWGSGKSSVFDILTEEIIEEQKRGMQTKIRIININVHKYEKSDILYIYFFDELLNILQMETILPRLDKLFITKNILEPFLKGLKIDSLLNKVMPLARIEKYLEKYTEWQKIIGIKIVCIIDDIDRIHDKKDLESVLKLFNLVKQNMSDVVILAGYDQEILANLLRKTDAIVENESSKTVNEILSKYFNKIYFIPHFTPIQLQKLVFNKINKLILDFNSSERSKKMFESDFKQMKKEKDILIENITTSRKYIKFINILSNNLYKLKNDINLKDIVLLSILESTNLELFDFIRKNYNTLTISNEVIHNSSNGEIVSNTFVENYNLFIKSNILDYESKKIIFKLLPHFEKFHKYKINIEKNISNFKSLFKKSITDRRFYNNILFDEFFFQIDTESNPYKIINQEYRFNLIEMLNNNDVSIEDVTRQIEPLFPLNKDNLSLQNHTLFWLEHFISNKSETITAKENIILVLSILIKGTSPNENSTLVGRFTSILEKFIQFYLLIERKKSQGLSFIKKIIEHEDNSELFANKCLKIVLDDEIYSKNISVQEKITIAETYIRRIISKLIEATSIFNKKYFDDTISTIWRWYEAEKFLKEQDRTIKISVLLSQHLEKELLKSPKNFELFYNDSFGNIGSRSSDFVSFNPSNKENLIPNKLTTELVKKYLDKTKHKTFNYNKIEAMKIWLDENNNNNTRVK